MRPNTKFHSVKPNCAAGLLLAAAVVSPAQLLRSFAQTTNLPALNYCSRFGGTSEDVGYGIARDSAGCVYIVGHAGWADTFALPFTSRFDPSSISWGTFVAKFDPGSRAFVYRVFIAACTGRAITVDASGNAYITGEMRADHVGYFQATNTCQPDYGGGELDAFVAKLSPDGSQLLYCTWLGGSRVDMGRAIAVDSSGQAIVMGITDSTNFPTAANGGIQTNLAGGRDLFVVKLGAAGTNLLASTYLGGRRNDDGAGLAVDTAGNVYIAGGSASTNFSAAPNPIQLGPLSPKEPVNPTAFVVKLTPDFAAVSYLTLFGGSGEDYGSAVAVDGSGNAFVFGQTSSADFPATAGALQTQFGGSHEDNFVVKLNAAGSSFLYATYLGGSGNEDHWDYFYISEAYPYWYLPAAGLALDAAGNAYVAGRTGSDDIAHGVPTANRWSLNPDGYVAKINPSGSALLHLRYLGGLGYDSANALTLDESGNIFVTGYAAYAWLPPYFPVTPGTIRAGGEGDAFLVELGERVLLPPNDNFANRSLLSSSARLTLQANNTAASKEPGEPAHAGNAGGKSLWWSWTAPVSGFLGLTTTNSSFDTLLAVYTGNTLAGLQLVASDAGSPSMARFPVVAGTAYQIAVDGKDGAGGSIGLSLTLSAEPNDDFANRLPLSGYPTVFGSNVNATLEPDELLIPRSPEIPLHTDWYGSRSVWWTWTAPEDADIEMSTLGSDFNTCLAVYTGTALTNLAVLKCSAEEVFGNNGVNTSRLTLKANAGTDYQIAVNGISDAHGMIQLNIFRSAPPTNDNFARRAVLTGSLLCLTNYNGSATSEPAEPSLGFDLPSGRTLWWTWTAPSNGWVRVSTAGSDFDTRLAAFTGDSLTNLTLVAANDDHLWRVPYSYYSRLNFEVTTNTAYNFVVDGGGQAPSGKAVFSLYFYQPPTIVPSSVGRLAGGAFGFQVQGWPRAYRVEASANLTDWSLVPSTNLFGPTFQFSETNVAGFRQRFYRVVEAH
jgi:hypothetical protein